MTVAFLRQPHPQLLRRRLRVRRAHGVRHRGDAARHRRLGAQRHGRARRALPRHLRRRAHRHRPVGASSRFHEERGALATIGLTPVENPLEFGIVITREDGSIERFLEKPTWGQVFSDTINTGIFVLEPEIFDYIAGRPVGRLLAARCSPRCSTTASRSTAPWPRATGRTWARSRPTSGPTRTCSTARSTSTSPASRSATACGVGEGAEIHPDARIDGPGRHRRLLPGRGRRPPRRVHRARHQRAGAGRRRPASGRSSTTTPTSARTCACGARSSAGRATCATACGPRRASCSATSASSASRPCSPPGVKVYPFKTVEAGAIINSSIVWESRGARSLFGRLGVAGLANVDVTPELATRVAMAFGTTLKKDATVITSRDSSRSARMLKRAMMAGLNAAGVNVRRPRGGVDAGHPLRRGAARGRRAASRIRLDNDDPQSVVIRFFDAKGADITEGAQRKIERLFLPRGLPPGVPRRDRRHRLPAPAPRALQRGARGRRRRRAHLAAPASRSSSTTRTASTSFVMPNVLSKLGADVLAVNPFASTAGHHVVRPRRARRQRGQPGAGVGRARWARSSTPTASTSRWSTTPGTCSATTRPCWRSCRWCRGTTRGPADRPAAVGDQPGRPPGRRPRGVEIVRTKLSNAALMQAAPEPDVAFAGEQRRRVHLARPSCRPSTPPPPWSSCSTCWRCDGIPLSKVVDGPAAACTSCTRPS